MFSPPLIQDLAIVEKVLFNAFWLWGPENTGPNPDIPFKIISKASRGPRYSGRLISVFLGPYCRGGGTPRIKQAQHQV